MATTMSATITPQPSGYTSPAFQYPQSQPKMMSPGSTSPTSIYGSGSTAQTTPPHTSPTTPNPYLPLAPRQLHPPKCPMYRPAALRTTERSTLVNGNKDSTPAPAAKSPTKTPKVADSVEQAQLPAVGSTEEVTGPPSRSNWKPDAEAMVCDLATCNKAFSLFDRRHHCRRCGNIFCAVHTSHILKLDQHCRYNVKGFESKVCNGCFDEYKRLCAKSRNSSTSNIPTVCRPLSTPQQAKTAQKNSKDGTLKGRLNSYVGSYRDNWSWSTF